MTSNIPRAFIDDTAIRTFVQGFLGATTFGAYNQYYIYEPMKQATIKQTQLIEKLEKNQHELETINYNQKQMIDRLEKRLNSRWWW
jgi:hypothetical protein